MIAALFALEQTFLELRKSEFDSVLSQEANQQIDREELVHLPNLTIKLEDNTPIVWGLVGIDGSLISIHCEVSNSTLLQF
jgi:hypothetical protein